MADIIKVKPKKYYQWNQDPKYIYIRIPIPANTTLKKLQIYLSDLILRVTSVQKKTTHFLDLDKQVDYLSSQNKFIISDGQLHVTLKKKEQQQWKQLLVQGISLAELKTRRRESEARKQQNIKITQENKQKIRNQHDRKATQQLMKFQQQQRKKLDVRKQAEKQRALNEVFGSGSSSLPSQNNKKQTQNKKKNSDMFSIDKNLSQQEKWKEKQRIALQMIQKQEQQQRKIKQHKKKTETQHKIIEQITKNQQRQRLSTQNTMFSEQDVEKYDKMRQEVGQTQYQEIPVRKEANLKMKFTQKVYPHMATRDFHYNDPPLPKKIAHMSGQKGDLEQKNPLWLKDKGDKLFKEKNFSAALDVYTQAIKRDQKFTNAYKNRSLCYMKLFDPLQAIKDCDKALSLMQGQIVSGQQYQKQARIDMIKIKTRKGICLAWKGYLKESQQFFNQLKKEIDESIPQEISTQIQDCLDKIKLRQNSIKQKIKGDRQVNLNTQKAISNYENSISLDRNQYSLSNKCLCLNRQNRFQECIQLADQGIKKINQFGIIYNINRNQGIKATGTLSEMAANLLLKLLFRKSKAHQSLNQLKDAEQTIRKGISISPEDKHFDTALKQILRKQRKSKLQEKKNEATQLLKNQKFTQALAKYSQCLKLIETTEDVIQQLAIMQNQSLCYLNLKQNDSMISVCVRGLKIIQNQRRKLIAIDGRKSDLTQKQKMDDFAKRFLVRKAYAYLQTNQKHNAKADLQKALQLDPKNQKIRKDYEQLISSLSQ